MKRTLITILLLAISINVFSKEKLFQPEVIEGEFIVKFSNIDKMKSFSKSDDLKFSKILNLTDGITALVRVQNDLNAKSLLNTLNKNQDIIFAEPNYRVHAIGVKSSQTNDPKFEDLWGLKNTGRNEPMSNGRNSSPTGIKGADIDAENAWKITKGSKSIKIAVIDTGVDYNHPDLKANIWTNEAEANGKPGVDDDGNGYVDDIHGYDFANKDGDPMDGNGHGTHCSGTIAAAHNNIGIAGVMQNATIVGVKFLTDQGSGSTADAILAIDYATKIGVDIMSNSWGGGGRSEALYEAIKRAQDAGIIFTAAAGNSSSDNDKRAQYPANYELDNVISVAAHNYNDQIASFSCYGANTVHVSAPGRNILSTTPGNTYSVYSGTSMATPHVTGVVGLYLAHKGKTDPAKLRDLLMQTSVYKKSYARKSQSMGRVHATNFLNHITPARPAKPNENDWISLATDLFETDHPYQPNTETVKTYKVPGAKFVRVLINQYHIEENYDGLYIYDKDDVEIQIIDGKGSAVYTEYVEGDTVKLKFKADNSVNEWGLEINQIQYIK